jgi:hypothetical protein
MRTLSSLFCFALLLMATEVVRVNGERKRVKVENL